jgi:hypothetical protein
MWYLEPRNNHLSDALWLQSFLQTAWKAYQQANYWNTLERHRISKQDQWFSERFCYKDAC